MRRLHENNSKAGLPTNNPITALLPRCTQRKGHQCKSQSKSNHEDNVQILRNLLNKLNFNTQTNKTPTLPHRRPRPVLPRSICSRGSKEKKTGSGSIQIHPRPKDSNCLNDIKIEKAIIDYSDIKNSFYLDKRENAKYVNRNVCALLVKW